MREVNKMSDIFVVLIIIGGIFFLMRITGGGCCGRDRHYRKEHQDDKN